MTPSILALDGHDAAGKTTLARLLVARAGGTLVRPFAGEPGQALMSAAVGEEPARVLAIAEEALAAAVATVATGVCVLDRGWVTVATLVEAESFIERWRERIPTVLCWSDLATTLRRLAERREPHEPVEWHQRHLDRYLAIARARGVPVVRTDSGRDVVACLDDVVAAAETLVR